jgi:multidrug efflux pump subunit AcrB
MNIPVVAVATFYPGMPPEQIEGNITFHIERVRSRVLREMPEFVAKASRVRLGPILMTSLATIIGLPPMALKLGEGSESYARLARALVGGLTISVLLTVFVVPVGFYLAYGQRLTKVS